MKRGQTSKHTAHQDHKKTSKRIVRSTSYKKSIGSTVQISSLKKSKKKEKQSGKLTNADLDESLGMTPYYMKLSGASSVFGRSPDNESRNDEKEPIQEIEILAQQLRAAKHAYRDVQARNNQNLKRVAELEEEIEEQQAKAAREKEKQAAVQENQRDMEEEVKALRYENCSLSRQAQRERNKREEIESVGVKSRSELANLIRTVAAQSVDRIDAIKTYVLAMEQVLSNEKKAQVFLRNMRNASEEVGELLMQLTHVAKENIKFPENAKRVKIATSFSMLRDELLNFIEESKDAIVNRTHERDTKEREHKEELMAAQDKLEKSTRIKENLERSIKQYQQEIQKMRSIIDRLREKLQEERDANNSIRKEQKQTKQGYGDFKYSTAVEPENELVMRLRAELANSRREIEELKESNFTIHQEMKKVETEKCFAVKQNEILKRRIEELVGPYSESSDSVQSSDVKITTRAAGGGDMLMSYLSKSEQDESFQHRDTFTLSKSVMPNREEFTAKFNSLQDKQAAYDLKTELDQLAKVRCLSTTVGGNSSNNTTPMNALLSPLNPLVHQQRGALLTLPSNHDLDYHKEARIKHKSLMQGSEAISCKNQREMGFGRNSLDFAKRKAIPHRGAFTPSEKLKNDIACLDSQIGDIQMRLEDVLERGRRG